jgi:hypothetical protein
MVHEFEHIRRVDSVSRCLAWVVGAMYWFHPMVWIAWRRLVLEPSRIGCERQRGGVGVTTLLLSNKDSSSSLFLPSLFVHAEY